MAGDLFFQQSLPDLLLAVLKHFLDKVHQSFDEVFIFSSLADPCDLKTTPDAAYPWVQVTCQMA